MNLDTITFQKPFGLFEMDANGTIIYSRDSVIPGFDRTNPSHVGLNFFDEVAPFKNVEEFRQQFKYFINGSNSSRNFIFDCHFEDTVLPVKVKLAQVSEREFNETKKLVIVDIRKI